MARSSIKVKKGALHAQLGIDPSKRIPRGRLQRALHSNSVLLRERAQFAINAAGWKHG